MNYNKEQLKCINAIKDRGVELCPLLSPQFDAAQLNQIQTRYELCVNVEAVAKPEYDAEHMKLLATGLFLGIDISDLRDADLDTNYIIQIMEERRIEKYGR